MYLVQVSLVFRIAWVCTDQLGTIFSKGVDRKTSLFLNLQENLSGLKMIVYFLLLIFHIVCS